MLNPKVDLGGLMSLSPHFSPEENLLKATRLSISGRRIHTLPNELSFLKVLDGLDLSKNEVSMLKLQILFFPTLFLTMNTEIFA